MLKNGRTQADTGVLRRAQQFVKLQLCGIFNFSSVRKLRGFFVFDMMKEKAKNCHHDHKEVP
jgi:hypothetical protein